MWSTLPYPQHVAEEHAGLSFVSLLTAFVVFMLIATPAPLYSVTAKAFWDDGDADVTGYTLHYGTSRKNYTTTIDVAGNQKSCRITGLEGGKTYYFAVEALNSKGLVSDFSDEATYVARETCDFNSDGKPDILWQHQTSGWVYVSHMDGTAIKDWAYVGRVSDTNWKIVGVADFNSDGKPDILWQHQTSGSVQAWFMDGSFTKSSYMMNVVDLNWKIVAPK